MKRKPKILIASLIVLFLCLSLNTAGAVQQPGPIVESSIESFLEPQSFVPGELIMPEEIIPTSNIIYYSRVTQVEIRGEMVDINLQVAENLKATGDQNVLLVHGFAHNGDVFKGLQKIILKNKDDIRRVVAIDLPGHGLSGYVGDYYGQTTLDNYRVATLQIMEWMKENMGPIIFAGGHSMGTLVLSMVQSDLIHRGTSIRQEFGTEGLLYLAPLLPDGIVWYFAQSGLLVEALVGYFRCQTGFGCYFDIDCNGFLTYFYSKRYAEEPIADAPSCEQIEKFQSFEPLVPALEVVFNRPVFDPGIFADYNLITVNYIDDVLFFTYEHQQYHDLLKGGVGAPGFYIETEDAVHSGFTIHPQNLVKYLDMLY